MGGFGLTLAASRTCWNCSWWHWFRSGYRRVKGQCSAEGEAPGGTALDIERAVYASAGDTAAAAAGNSNCGSAVMRSGRRRRTRRLRLTAALLPQTLLLLLRAVAGRCSGRRRRGRQHSRPSMTTLLGGRWLLGRRSWPRTGHGRSGRSASWRQVRPRLRQRHR